jgi:hypothetical protein
MGTAGREPGRLWAVANDRGPGTTFQFTVPALAGS